MLGSFRVNGFRRLYQLSKWFQLHFTRSGQFIMLAIVVSGVFGFDTTRTLSYQIFCALLALIALALLASLLNKTPYRCRRQLPPLATVGEPLHYRAFIENLSGNHHSDLMFVDRLEKLYPSEPELRAFVDHQSLAENRFDRVVGYPRWLRLTRFKTGADTPRQQLQPIAGGAQIQVNLSLTPLRRGYLRFSDSSIGCPDPTGLYRSVKHFSNPQSVLVLPKRYTIPPIQLSGIRHYQQGGVNMASSVGESTEFHGLRDYQPGDPLRHIHWRSWARQGTPVVKKYEDEYFVRHALVLDTYTQKPAAKHKQQLDFHQLFEEAVSVAASIALNLEDQESLLDLMFVEQKAYHVTAGRGLGDISAILEVLACVMPQNQYPCEQLEELVLSHAQTLSSVVCVLLQWDENRQQLVRNIRQLGLQTLVLVLTDHEQPLAAGPMADCPELLHGLNIRHMQRDLAKLSRAIQ